MIRKCLHWALYAYFIEDDLFNKKILCCSIFRIETFRKKYPMIERIHPKEARDLELSGIEVFFDHGIENEDPEKIEIFTEQEYDPINNRCFF